MKFVLLSLLLLITTGCDKISPNTGRYSLFETSKGVVYRLNAISGKSEIIYSPTGWPKLSKEAIFEDENGKTYQYLGSGKLKELSVAEVAEIYVKKYAK